MVTQKRRVVYLSDNEWESLKSEATRFNRTMSAQLRYRLGFDPQGLYDIGEAVADHPKQASTGFNTRPFTPVPKTGHK